MRNKIVRCNKCGHEAEESEFPHGVDFFQNRYVSACPNDCGNRQSPGAASMRMFGGGRPFSYVDRPLHGESAADAVVHRAEEAS